MPSMVISDGNFVLNYQVTQANETTHILTTQNHFLDKNIVLKISSALTTSPTLNITDKPTTNIGVGTADGGYYPLTANLTGTMTFGTAGWIATGGMSAADDNVIVGRVAQSTLSTTAVTPNPTSNTTVTISAGYYDAARTITIAPMSSGVKAAATVSASATMSAPTAANVASSINGMTQVTIAPTTATLTTANGKYFVAFSATAPGATVNVSTPNVTTAGYLGPVGTTSQISVTKTNGAAVGRTFYAPLATASAKVVASGTAATPTAVTSTATVGTKVNLSAAPTTTTASLGTYYFAINVTAPATTVTLTKTLTTAGYLGSTDEISVSGSTSASSSTIYIPVTSGALSKGAGSVSATGNISLTEVGSQPASGYYISATGSGTVSVGTGGWIPKNSSTASNAATKIYEIPTASFTKTGNVVKTATAGYIGANVEVGTISTGTISTTSTNPTSGYTENTTAIVPSGGYLLIGAGYYNATKISLATLVPDTTTTTAAAVGHILSGYKAFDKDGNLLTGTIPTYQGEYTFST